MLSNGLAVQCIHHGLERGRRVSETEEHYSRFVKSPSRFERRLVFVPCLDTDVVVPPSYVQLRVDHGPSQVSDQGSDEGERILIAHCPFVNIPVILYRPQLPVLLFDEEERQSIRGD